jgi:hypothetical protein
MFYSVSSLLVEHYYRIDVLVCRLIFSTNICISLHKSGREIEFNLTIQYFVFPILIRSFDALEVRSFFSFSRSLYYIIYLFKINNIVVHVVQMMLDSVSYFLPCMKYDV